MAQKSGIWAEVEHLASKGQAPQVVLPKGSKVVVPKQPSGGRRTRPLGAGPYHNFIMRSPRGQGLRCRWRCCYKRIPSKRACVTCSDQCKALLREYCETVLAIFNGEMSALDFPAHFRTQKFLR